MSVMNKCLAIGTFFCGAFLAAVPSAHATLTASHFSGWSVIPDRAFQFDPAIAQFGNIRTFTGTLPKGQGFFFVFGTGTDNRIYRNFWDSVEFEGWSPVGNAGAVFKSSPAATGWPDPKALVEGNQLDGAGTVIASVGFNGAISLFVIDPIKKTSVDWHQPAKLALPSGHVPLTAPAIAYAKNVLYLARTDTDGKVYLFTNNVAAGYSAANWSGANQILNGTVQSAPSMLANGFSSSFLTVAALGLGSSPGQWFVQGNMINNPSDPFNDGFSSASWHRAGGGTYSRALATAGSAVSGFGSHLDIFGIGLDNKVWVETAENGVWSTAGLSLGGPAMASRPAAASWAAGHINVVARAAFDNKFYVNTFQD